MGDPGGAELGDSSAYGWHHGSAAGGKCLCKDRVTSVLGSAASRTRSADGLRQSGKTVELQMQQTSHCGGDCTVQDVNYVFTVVGAHNAVMLAHTDPASPVCRVHVTAHPAFIKLHVASRLACLAPGGHLH